MIIYNKLYEEFLNGEFLLKCTSEEYVQLHWDVENVNRASRAEGIETAYLACKRVGRQPQLVEVSPEKLLVKGPVREYKEICDEFDFTHDDVKEVVGRDDIRTEVYQETDPCTTNTDRDVLWAFETYAWGTCTYFKRTLLNWENPGIDIMQIIGKEGKVLWSRD